MYTSCLISLLVLLGCFSPTYVRADEVATLRTRLSPQNFAGVSAEEVLRRFGAPDRKVSSKRGGEVWYYGAAKIIFSGTKVAGWLNPEELFKRESLQQVKVSDGDTKNTFRDRGWKNPWTPEADIDPLEVLKEISPEIEN